ncbi:MAG TPA: GntR family transcriptional regulator [Thermoleophilaceae bacterium]|nr:GntR family transcriptional regulator [Thermoleophilaceae bacterium]
MGEAPVRLPERHLLADDVYETVKAMLMDHTIAPGARLSIDGLARQLRVSQTPIRETLARLESEGLVTKQPMRGYSATSLLDRESLEDIYELRLLLEPWAAARAAARATDDDIARLEAELATCPVAPAGTDYHAYRLITAHDARFHDLVAELSGSEQVRAAFERTHAHLHLFRLSYGQNLGSEALREHHLIVEAIARRSARDARQAMREHLVTARDRLVPMVG